MPTVLPLLWVQANQKEGWQWILHRVPDCSRLGQEPSYELQMSARWMRRETTWTSMEVVVLLMAIWPCQPMSKSVHDNISTHYNPRGLPINTHIHTHITPEYPHGTHTHNPRGLPIPMLFPRHTMMPSQFLHFLPFPRVSMSVVLSPFFISYQCFKVRS